MLRAVVITMRPWQWVKNVLVAAAPLAAGTLGHAHVLAHALIAFGAFCLASSAVYCVNDVCDREADRLHPRKRRRPVAAGTLSVPAALTVATVLAAGALVLATPNPLRLVVGIYLAVSVGYSVGLKREPVLELALVASGFLLRAIAGGPATGIPLSRWFLIVAGFGSLLIVVGKRLSEMTALGTATATRPALVAYPRSYLQLLLGMSAAVTVTGYGLWAFPVGERGSVWAAVSAAPFVVAVLRYALHADAGEAEEPERVLARDHLLQVLIVAWVAAFSLSAFHG